MKILEDITVKGDTVVLIFDRTEGRAIVEAFDKLLNETKLVRKGTKQHKLLTEIVNELPVYTS